jgi:signal peptidase II
LNRNLLISSIFIVSLVLDQWTKVIAREKLASESFSYWGDTFRLVLAENSGAFLSLGSSLSETARFFIFTVGIGILMLAGLVLLFRKKKLSQLETIAYSLVLSGGVGNLIDRGMKSTVTDFMNIGIGSIRTGVFNIADMGIMLGVGILFYTGFKKN